MGSLSKDFATIRVSGYFWGNNSSQPLGIRHCSSASKRRTESSGAVIALENYSLEYLLRRELTFTSMPNENVLRTLYTLRLYPALKSSERVRL